MSAGDQAIRRTGNAILKVLPSCYIQSRGRRRAKGAGGGPRLPAAEKPVRIPRAAADRGPKKARKRKPRFCCMGGDRSGGGGTRAVGVRCRGCRRRPRLGTAPIPMPDQNGCLSRITSRPRGGRVRREPLGGSVRRRAPARLPSRPDAAALQKGGGPGRAVSAGARRAGVCGGDSRL